MRLVIAGSRSLTPSVDELEAEVAAWLRGVEVVEVVSGRCLFGVDPQGEAWARSRGIPVRPFPVEKADWKARGLAAGQIRNRAMAAYGDALLAWWDGESPGTRGMVRAMRALGKPTRVVLQLGGGAS